MDCAEYERDLRLQIRSDRSGKRTAPRPAIFRAGRKLQGLQPVFASPHSGNYRANRLAGIAGGLFDAPAAARARHPFDDLCDLERATNAGSGGDAVSQDLCGSADGPHLESGQFAGAAARGAHEFLRHRVRSGRVRAAAGDWCLPGQSRQRPRVPGCAEFQSSFGNRGANGAAMKIVIKFAGALLEHRPTVESLAAQVASLAQQGHEILVGHGGGRIFTATLKRLGIESKFVAGLRVTDRDTRDVAVMVFAGLLNKQLAAAISAAGQAAAGSSAADAQCFRAEPLVHNEVEGSLGYVGYLTGANTDLLEAFWKQGLVPVAACLGLGADGELYNINADHMAAACAEYLEADRLIYLTDVAGVLDGEKILSNVACDEIGHLVETRVVSGGMVLKLEAAKRALEGGVRGVHIVGGTAPGGLFAAV